LNNLLQDFQEAGNIQLMNVGKAFVSMIDSMKIYGIYSSNHSGAVKTYEQIRKKNKKVAEFIKEKEASPDCQQINLLGFLIKPVQRLTKYHLLFREILKHTPKDHPDYGDIEKCFEKVQEVAAYVNERQRTSESLQKMIEIQENLVDYEKGFSVYSSDRMFIREGTLELHVEGEKKQAVHYFLFNDILLYCKTQLSKKATFKFKGYVPLEKCLIADLSDAEAKNAFQIIRTDIKKKCTAICGTPAEKKLLFADITKVVNALITDGQMQRKSSVSSVSELPPESPKDYSRAGSLNQAERQWVQHRSSLASRNSQTNK